jgi:hypothetical protein
MKQQIRSRFGRVPQVSDPIRTTLSRWKHGFEPRWDYAGSRRCRLAEGRYLVTLRVTVFLVIGCLVIGCTEREKALRI